MSDDKKDAERYRKLVTDLRHIPIRVPETWEQSQQLIKRCQVALRNSPVVMRLVSKIPRVTEDEAVTMLAEMAMVADYLRLIGDCLPSISHPESASSEPIPPDVQSQVSAMMRDAGM